MAVRYRQMEVVMTEISTLSSARWFLRLAIAGGFLSAVTDRFGIWGGPGTPNVAWGAWPPFVEHAAKLNWFAPSPMIPFLAGAATFAETVLGLGLIVGWQLRWFALGSGLLLLSFALTMTLALGIKAPLNYSVFAASAGAFFLAASTKWQAEQP
jgi:putative oxidoreductase